MIRLLRTLPLRLTLRPSALVSPAAVILRPSHPQPAGQSTSTIGSLLLAKKNHTSEDEEDSWVVEKDRRYEKSRYDRDHQDEHIKNRRTARPPRETHLDPKTAPNKEAAPEPATAEPADQDLHDINDEDEGVSNLHKEAEKQAQAAPQEPRPPQGSGQRRQRYYSSQEDHDDALRERDEEYEHRRGRPQVGRWEDDDRRPRRRSRRPEHPDDHPGWSSEEEEAPRRRPHDDGYLPRRYVDDGHYGGRRYDEYDRRYQRPAPRRYDDRGARGYDRPHPDGPYYDGPEYGRPRQSYDEADYDRRDHHPRARPDRGHPDYREPPRPRSRQRPYSSDEEDFSDHDGHRGPR